MLQAVLVYVVLAGDASVQLSKYLLHTLCADLMNMVLAYLAEDGGKSLPTEEEMNFKVRVLKRSQLLFGASTTEMWILSCQ